MMRVMMILAVVCVAGVVAAPVATKPVETEDPNDLTCSLCTHAIAELANMLLDTNVWGQLMEALKSVCSHMGSAEDMCFQIIAEFARAIAQFVLQTPPRVLCFLLSLCDLMPTEPIDTSAPVDIDALLQKAFGQLEDNTVEDVVEEELEDTQCEVCKTMVAALFAMAKDPSVRAKIHEVCADLCGKIEQSETCYAIVETIVDTALDMACSMEPEQACAYIRQCAAPPMLAVPLTFPGQQENDLTCELCVHAVVELQNLLFDTDIVARIVQGIRDVCKHTGAAEAACNEIIMQLVGAVIQLIAQSPPRIVCWLVSLCDTTPAQAMQFPEWKPIEEIQADLAARRRGAPVVAKDNDVQCEVCKSTMSFLIEMAKDETTRGKIHEVVAGLCEKIPGTEICNSVVDVIVETVLDLACSMDPEWACSFIFQCQEAPVAFQLSSVPLVKPTLSSTVTMVATPFGNGPKSGTMVPNDLCGTCITIVSFMKKNRWAVTAVFTALSGVCYIIPVSGCSAIVSQLSEIVSFLLDTMEPNDICTYASLCKSEMESMPMIVDGEENAITCDICTSAVQFVKDNATDEAWAAGRELVVKGCEYVSEIPLDMCEMVMTTFYDYAHTYVDSHDAPACCSAAGIC